MTGSVIWSEIHDVNCNTSIYALSKVTTISGGHKTVISTAL